MKTLYLLVSLLNGALSLTIPPLLSALDDLEADLSPRQSTEAACENTATSRSCWGNYSIDTNYYVCQSFPYDFTLRRANVSI